MQALFKDLFQISVQTYFVLSCNDEKLNGLQQQALGAASHPAWVGMGA